VLRHTARRRYVVLGERRTLLTGLALGTAGFAVYGLAPTSTFIWLGVPLQAMWGIANPASMALMTRHVPPTEQGQLQGANASLQSIAGIFAPALFSLTFAATLLTLPGAAFIMAGAMLLVAMAIGWRVTAEDRA